MSAAFLIARDLTKSYGARVVLDGVSVTAGAGRRIGLVGDNGTGKSTLLRLLAGLDAPDTGDVVRHGDVGFLHQELPYDHADVVATVIADALAAVRRVERELAEVAERVAVWPEDAGLLATYGDLLEWAQAHEIWDADRRAELVLDGLGLAGVEGTRTLATLSGGQRSRLGLAALLVRQPRILVLDEPTNHLDDAAIAFLQRHLAALPGAVVLASHDRVFLDAVCTDIVDLDPDVDGITHYGGTFSDYLHAKQAARARWEQRYAAEQGELVRLREAITVTARQVSHGAPRGNTSKLAYDYKGARVDKQISRRVRDARQRFEELERAQVRKPPQPLRFAAPVTSAGGDDEVAVRVRAAGVGTRVWLDELDLVGDGRLLVTGPNGAGKSSLLYLMAGWVLPDTGMVQHRRGLRVGLLEQDVLFSDAHHTPRRIYAAATGGRGDVPTLGGLGLLAGRDLDRPVGVLSVGQRRRLALAVLIADPPHVLLLDEPTNHLSLSLASELEEALRAAPGALVVASHDRWLRRRWDGAALALERGRIVGTPSIVPGAE